MQVKISLNEGESVVTIKPNLFVVVSTVEPIGDWSFEPSSTIYQVYLYPEKGVSPAKECWLAKKYVQGFTEDVGILLVTNGVFLIRELNRAIKRRRLNYKRVRSYTLLKNGVVQLNEVDAGGIYVKMFSEDGI